ncbi:AMP-binding protein [Microbacterium sp.]|uniref:AMP-binding protein n=1 Tax=Microbacterium sp. TaxID=51671 RepID=UPI002810ADB2|nr:AMP-binding protein [Microbacterium sp.]
MPELIALPGDDPVQVRDGIRRALDGGPAIGLGMLPAPGREVPEGTAAVIATSGSSGIPKQVVLSAAALRASAEATAARIGAGRWVLTLPAGYVAGLQALVRSALAGTEPVLLSGSFRPLVFADATLVHAAGADLYTSLVPAQLATLLDAADDPVVRSALRAYRAILVGGQSLPEAIRERAEAVGARVVRTYGSTETSGGCVYDGVPLDGVTVRQVEGELRVSGPVLADGYLGDDALTERVFVRDAHGIRWYRTGDLGLVDDGVVRVHGRADNVIVSGGINISLDRVERVVRGIPGLDRAVVIGVPDERWGEACAIVAPRGAALRRTEAEQLEQARHAVASEVGAHARPTRLIVVDELPVLASGKPDREQIRRAIADPR